MTRKVKRHTVCPLMPQKEKDANTTNPPPRARNPKRPVDHFQDLTTDSVHHIVSRCRPSSPEFPAELIGFPEQEAAA